jgi:hypothetical protein
MPWASRPRSFSGLFDERRHAFSLTRFIFSMAQAGGDQCAAYFDLNMTDDA